MPCLIVRFWPINWRTRKTHAAANSDRLLRHLQVRRDLQALYDGGIRSLAVVLKHSAIFPEHERVVGEVAKDIGFTQVGGALLR